MILLLKRIFARPRKLIPVFFLFFFSLEGQFLPGDAGSASLGGSFAAASGFSSVSGNQAGLGWTDQRSVSLNHSMPFMIPGLGSSVLAAQFPALGGAIGVAISSTGMTGFRQSSLWCAYGMKLSRQVTAGIGLYYSTISLFQKLVYGFRVNCAAGIQLRIHEKLKLGAHVRYPVGWTAKRGYLNTQSMHISTGLSYTFFQTNTYFADIQMLAGGPVRVSSGIQTRVNKSVTIRLGLHNKPISYAGGIEIHLSKLILLMTSEYIADIGTTPYTALAYEW